MRGAALALLLFAVLGANVGAAEDPREPKELPTPRNTVSPTPTLPLPLSQALVDGQPASIDRIPFSHGETLHFHASWGGISVGDATMSVETGANFEGKPAIHIKAQAKSNRTFSMFFAIHDATESWIDPAGLYSLGFLSDQSEGGRQDYQRWILDYAHGLAHRYRVHRDKHDKLESYVIDFPLEKANVQDAASMLYFFRAFDLKVGQTLSSDVYVSKELWTLHVKVESEEKNVKVPAGRFDCLKVVPRVEKNGKPQSKGKMTVWLSEDDLRIPVKIETEVPLGKVHAVLKDFKEGEGS